MKKIRIFAPESFIELVPGAGIEPAQPLGPRDFKSLASTYSATRAFHYFVPLLIPEFKLDIKKKGKRSQVKNFPCPPA